MVREREGFSVENDRAVGPNVISFELVTGKGEEVE